VQSLLENKRLLNSHLGITHGCGKMLSILGTLEVMGGSRVLLLHLLVVVQSLDMSG
jgi:hypothetical protein